MKCTVDIFVFVVLYLSTVTDEVDLSSVKMSCFLCFDVARVLKL